ncbi:hypothetical protein SAMN02910447_01395 [Ruminococcus sp. YE71]|uniref:metallophosphoesterase n=1 Tax=unclassified Ruminococcus TaxID=2608920 RepID=UPI000882F5B5|nr:MULTISPECIES: metallophosphoesterase [unclassified Ruminococcus]SDA19167.1 hypothetical protein SAMN02910446_01579 [Ruminococcus sp. YE78]SFW28533.1 hypothetical protein SAMN02910447_01395 [Ruminococcus sp. YE71]
MDKKTKLKKRLKVWGIVLAVLFVFSVLNNKWLTVSEYDFTDSRIENGFTIVQVSDLHNARFGRGNRRLIERIRSLSPDIIAITGDLVDGSFTNVSVGVDFCEQAAAICPTYYVTGNHEHWLSDDEKRQLFDGIRDSGTVILDDETVTVGINGDRVQLCGLDDDSLYTDTLRDLSAEFDRSMPVILLAHEPQYFSDYCTYSPDLVLTGHAHGGQVRLPFIGGLVAPDQGFFPKYTEGKFTDGETAMIVSRGLGNSVIPVRVFDPPEIVSVHVSGK